MSILFRTIGSLFVLLISLAPASEGKAAPASGKSEEGFPADGAATLADAFRRAAAKAGPSVVTIETYSGPRETIEWARKVAGTKAGDDSDNSSDLEITGARNGIGTGIVLDAQGYILTCNHVISNADMAFVRLADGRRFEVVKTLQDPFTDVAVVQIEHAGPLPAAEVSEDELSVGDWVVTIGNPYGLGVSLTAGVVSATDRHMRHIPYAGLIQTDAATNPGNSGGALVDLEGKVVGMSEGGYGVVEGFQGIGFAIPIDLARRVARELIDKGKVNRPFLGIETELIPVNIANHLKLDKPGGVIVCDIAPRSPAARAGVQVGDVLTHVDGSAVSNHFEFFRLVDETPDGKPISLTLLRDFESIAIDLIPSPLYPQVLRPEKSDFHHVEPPGFIDKQLGLTVDVFTSETARELGYKGPVDGLLITHVEDESIAAKQGICAGMSMVRVDGESVKSVEDYRTATKKRDLAKGTLLLLGTTRQKHFVLCQE